MDRHRCEQMGEWATKHIMSSAEIIYDENKWHLSYFDNGLGEYGGTVFVNDINYCPFCNILLQQKSSVYQEVIDLFGDKHQLVVAIEEASEVVHALSKIFRYGVNAETINYLAVEMAQFEIMKNQLFEMFKDIDFPLSDGEGNLKYRMNMRFILEEEKLIKMCEDKRKENIPKPNNN